MFIIVHYCKCSLLLILFIIINVHNNNELITILTMMGYVDTFNLQTKRTQNHNIKTLHLITKICWYTINQ